MWTLVRCGAAVLALAAWCGPAAAWTGEVTWPTFYRAGPGRNYTVLDEIDRGATFEVLSCKDGWCQVQSGRSIGYMEQKWIRPPVSTPRTPGPQDCVESRVTGSGYKGGLEYQFCSGNTQFSIPSGQPAPGSENPKTN